MSFPTANREIQGVGSLCLGAFVFSLQDVIIKTLSGDHAVTLAIVTRCLVAFPILLVMVQMEVGITRLSSPNLGLHLLRGGLLLVAYTTYFMALAALPLAQAIALYFTVPILVTLLAWPVLGERVGLKAWLAVAAGFIGILIILRPGTGLFEPAALLSLASATAYALSMLLARRLGTTESATVMAFYQNAVYLVGASFGALVFALFGIDKLGHPSLDFLVRPWAMPGLLDTILMGLCGIIAALGMWLLTNAYRLARASLVTVFEYTGMIWAPLWGYVIFSEIPRWTTVVGGLIILASGIFAVRNAAIRPTEVKISPTPANEVGTV
jgi:drug/metabolite transporter (DMT)-like permease